MTDEKRPFVPEAISHVTRPRLLLSPFLDTEQAAQMLNKSRSTVADMAARGLLTRYRVGAAVLYWGPEVYDVAQALRRLQVRS